MLYLGLLPRLDEVKLHKINHYLSPIIDELLEFWDGVDLLFTNLHLTGKRIRLAVICYTNDILAARKLCSYISTLVSYYRCYKMANISKRRFNFEEFKDINIWFTTKHSIEHQYNAKL
jgi:hypothetical protein